jgi:hypothetical protein
MTPPTPEQLKAAIRVTDGVASREELQIIWALGQKTERAEAIAARVLLAHVRAVHAEVAANAQNQETNTGCQQHDIEGESKREAFTEAAALLLPESAS